MKSPPATTLMVSKTVGVCSSEIEYFDSGSLILIYQFGISKQQRLLQVEFLFRLCLLFYVSSPGLNRL